MTAAGTGSQHTVHVATLLGPALLVAAWAGWADVRAWRHRHQDSLASGVLLAGLLSIGAAVIHAVVTPAHLTEDPLYGGFFAVLAAAQLGWGVVAVVRPQRWLLTAGALGNLAVLTLWAVTRTSGIPLGVATGERESVGVLDTTTALLELVVVGCCLWALRSRQAAPAAASVHR